MGSAIKTNKVEAVKGTIQSSEIGFCHSHEHLFLADGQSAKVHPALRLDDFDKTFDELFLYKKVGGSTIVDAQPVGCGRIAQFQAEASERSGINIIASTGFHKLIFYPEDHWIHSIDEDDLTNLFISEIKSGMYIDADYELPSKKISSLPGVIKTASDLNGVDRQYKRLFSAAAEASIRTGTPVLSHTEMGAGALSQIQIFTDHGIPSDSIIICHLDRTVKDISYHIDIAKTGVYMEFDTIGRFKYHSDEDEAAFIYEMVSHGFEDKILIGLDTTRERMKSYGGSLGLDYIQTYFIPLLKKYGIKDETIKKFVTDNPARAFSKYKKIKQE